MVFSKRKEKVTSQPDNKHSCAQCGLYQQCESGKMEPFGNFRKGIMNIGEAPGLTEDEQGKPWQGKVGRYLNRVYRLAGIDLFEDCINLNAINCRPPKNRTPEKFEIDCCRRIVLSAIEEYQPKVIVLFGGAALQSVVGNYWKKDLRGISRWQGWAVPDQNYKTWILPTFHPSYVLREKDGAADTIWLRDLEKASSLISEPLPRFREPNIRIIEDLSPLKDILSGLVSIDFETTGLKPQAKGHRIVCAAVATDEDNAYAFMVPGTPAKRKPFTDILENNSIGKMAHNIKFEMAWAHSRLNTEIRNVEWDSMLAAHVLDNRTGVTGLKFQVYVNFGVADYSSEVTPFLERQDEKNANAKNYILDMDDAERTKLLEYCAKDAIFQYRLSMKQIQEMDYKFLPF